MPLKNRPSSGSWFHSLHATSHALHPMQTVVSVKKPLALMVLRLLSSLRRSGLHAMSAEGALAHPGEIPGGLAAADRHGQRAAGHHPAPAAPAAGLDVAGQALRFLDRDVG